LAPQNGNNPAFENYYLDIYGGRWKALRESLLAPPSQTAYGEGLLEPYYLDRASVLAASSLILKDHETGEAVKTILDACAAPGGKSLVLASRMGPGTGLLSNEFSSQRRRRLAAVLDRYLPPETRARVRVAGFNAAAAAGRKSERGRFDAVLLDAPCSSERHVLRDEKALAQWTAARPRFLSQRQWSLLSAAFLLLRPGSSLVYATCALNPEENDGVAGKLMKKYSGSCILERPGFPEGEETAWGRLILPDVSGGSGPLYVARFRKKA
jgi:16S rRNA (cytosine1407-C5)-methyltransferase